MKTMKKILSSADKIFDTVVKYFAYLGAAILALMAVSITLDVILRSIFNYPIKWVFEATEYSLLIITFLAGTWVLQKDKHVKLDLLLLLFGTKTRARINGVTSLIMAGVCLVFAWSSTVFTIYLIQKDVVITKYYTIPQFIIFIVIPLGFILLFIQSLKRAYGYFSLKTEET